MTCSRSIRILLVVWGASLAAAAASADVADADRGASAVPAQGSYSMPKAGVPDSMEADAPTLPMPANVLEETPADARGKPVGTCAYDPPGRQVTAACRRRLEIAQTL